jgi:phosphoribosylformylglycinamidine (FGAM) synthase PurS component
MMLYWNLLGFNHEVYFYFISSISLVDNYNITKDMQETEQAKEQVSSMLEKLKSKK